MHRMLAVLLALALLASCGGRVDRQAPVVPAKPDPETNLLVYPRYGDSKPHPWRGRDPYSYPIHGIDVSRYQGDIDWLRTRSAGINFAFIKATEGGDYVDPMFQDHWNGARRAGLRHGAYHFYYFCRPAHEQARWFIANVPRSSSDLPHVLDMEWNHQSRTCRLRPDAETIRAEATVFLDMLKAHYGRRPVVYTTVDFFAHSGIEKLRNTEFWLRSVAGHPRQVYPGAFWTFWQYTGTGIVPGVNGPVDLNVFRASPEIWLRWAG